MTRDEAVEQAGFAVPVADTTGAGDTFHAAFLAAHLRGIPLAEALRFANATAALYITVIGPRGLLPTVDDVEAFLDTDMGEQWYE